MLTTEKSSLTVMFAVCDQKHGAEPEPEPEASVVSHRSSTQEET